MATTDFSAWRYIGEYITSSVWGGLSWGLGSRGITDKIASWGPREYSKVIFYKKDETRKRCALTIDDAPGDPELMGELLDALQESNVKASFFVISSYVRENDERRRVFDRILSDGHEVCNHLQFDRVAKDPYKFEDDLRDCETLIEGSTGAKFFRPPSGRMAQWMLPILAERGYKTVLGDAYAMDVATQCYPDWIVRHTIDHTGPGSVIILHCPEPRKRANQVYVTKALIKALLADGFEICMLSQMFASSQETDENENCNS